MPQPVRAPRVNNNDDTVRLSHIFIEIGTRIRPGEPLLDVETDKATFTVESELDGYLLAVNGQVGDTVSVGSILAWIGSAPDEPVTISTGSADASPDPSGPPAEANGRRPTLKALMMMKQLGVAATDIPNGGPQLRAEDVRRHATGRKAALSVPPPHGETKLPVSGHQAPLSREERGMFRTVLWQKEEAAAAYLEISYDPEPWRVYAAAFQKDNGLWFDPALALFAWKLSKLALETPKINATVWQGDAFLYDRVNVGFTVQADSTLYLVVVQDAQLMDEREFVREISGLQLSAMRHALTPEQTSGATGSFSSMARWNVCRHVPILPPHTSLCVSTQLPKTASRISAPPMTTVS